MNIKFNQVTWYSKLAAIVVFVGITPVITFYIGKEYGEVKNLSQLPIYTSSDTEKIIIQKELTPNLKYFIAKTPINTGGPGYSNIVGYFANGNFFFYVPQWIPDNWSIGDLPNGGMKLSPKDPHDLDFSDILISIATTTENYNAETLYSKDASSENKALCISGSRCEIPNEKSPIVSTEILISTVSDSRIYHVVRSLSNGTIEDRFYIDGKKVTATITFWASKENYSVYEQKIREFVQGIGKGGEIRG